MSKEEDIIMEDIDFIINSNIPWKIIQGKNFLISGANGFLPSYMIYTLLKLNERTSRKSKIYALVRNKKKANKKFKNFLDNKFLKILEHDLTTDIKIRDRIDYVIHAASQASPKFFNIDPIGTLLPNIIGTKNLLEFASHKKVKSFLFLSSGEIYGQIKTMKETDFGFVDPLDIRSCYAESKRMGENMCIAWLKQKGTPTKIARIFHTYGPGIQLDDRRVYADFVSNVVNNENIVVKSDGMAKRPFCYISDAITAFFIILLKGKNGHAYNVSNPHCNVTIMNLAKIILEQFPEKKLRVVMKKEPLTEKYSKSKIKVQKPDISKLVDLGWNPHTSIEEGFRRTIMSKL